ncbi:glycosyltransferase family 4 protein [Planktosalinus lacus]|uniref:Glycosyl transferase family 1 n=1 Tax=Planktosalinus lacus TaxID=1526573 RepID=A0A8J2VDH5_9FLAO|nr:glycosyltransferase family 4 protein [Planktosalinus lacus]GGD98587.1 glycosyl transferase family 1 [Planktosalinus lacus]
MKNPFKVLIVTYYWPPAGGPGVQRWLKFVKYLRDFDVEPVVFVPENPHYPLIDDSFESEIPKGIEVIKYPIKEPYRFAKLLSKKKTQTISSGIISDKKQSLLEKFLLWVRGNYFIPDARVGWVKPSVKFLEEYLIDNPVDVIITSGPPHSLHLIGMELKKITKTPWVADFRDPWTSIGYHKKLNLSKKSQRKHEKLEANVLQTADHIIVTSQTTEKQFEVITDVPITVITNGYDTEIAEEVKLDTKFTVSHIGSLLTERNPEILWKIFYELINENKSFALDFQLQLAGVVSDEVVKSIKSYGLSDYLINIGYISHNQVLDVQRKSQVLLVLEIDSIETRAIIPGKIFEYLAAQRPILALGPKESDIEFIINQTGTGVFCNYNKEAEIKETLLSWYQKYKDDKLVLDPTNINQYSRKNLTKKLAKILKAI